MLALGALVVTEGDILSPKTKGLFRYSNRPGVLAYCQVGMQ